MYMHIAIDISPLQTGHKVRGVGFYLKHLKDALVTYFPEHEYSFFTRPEEISAKSDLIHYPYFDPFFRTLPLFQKKKTVVTVHDLTPLVFREHFPAGIKGNLIWQIQRLALKKTAAIITDSECSGRDVARFVGISKKKVHSVYLAAGEEFKKMTNDQLQMINVRKKYNLPEKFVLYVGDVTWNKNLPRLVDAMNKINVPLVMVGKAIAEKVFDRTNPWNADRLRLEQLTKNNKNIMKLGFVPDEDLVALYNSATVFAFPSLYEGFGLPVLEAMACGTPVVTTAGGSLQEVAGDAAYLVDGLDMDDIAHGIQEVFAKKELQKKILEKGLKQARKFNWKKTAEETIGVYREVIKS